MTIFRPNTVDKDVWLSCHEGNEYNLPDDLTGWTIIDIGAHIGGFTHACLERGCDFIYAFEPHPENFSIARQNLTDYGNKVILSKLAVWDNSSISRHAPKLSSFGLLGTTINTGGSSIVFGQGIEEVRTIPFDDIIAMVLDSEAKAEVDLVKLDCEGSEWPILFTSQRLQDVKMIVGEFHEGKLPFTINGKDTFTVDDLKYLLETHGFTFEYRRHGEIEEGLGLFYAKR